MRNLGRNPACTLHLESGAEVVIVEGISVATRADPDGLGGRLARAFEKYHPEYVPGPESWAGGNGGGLRVIVPKRVLAWFAFPRDCTRFTFFEPREGAGQRGEGAGRGGERGDQRPAADGSRG